MPQEVVGARGAAHGATWLWDNNRPLLVCCAAVCMCDCVFGTCIPCSMVHVRDMIGRDAGSRHTSQPCAPQTPASLCSHMSQTRFSPSLPESDCSSPPSCHSRRCRSGSRSRPSWGRHCWALSRWGPAGRGPMSTCTCRTDSWGTSTWRPCLKRCPGTRCPPQPLPSPCLQAAVMKWPMCIHRAHMCCSSAVALEARQQAKAHTDTMHCALLRGMHKVTAVACMYMQVPCCRASHDGAQVSMQPLCESRRMPCMAQHRAHAPPRPNAHGRCPRAPPRPPLGPSRPQAGART